MPGVLNGTAVESSKGQGEALTQELQAQQVHNIYVCVYLCMCVAQWIHVCIYIYMYVVYVCMYICLCEEFISAFHLRTAVFSYVENTVLLAIALPYFY